MPKKLTMVGALMALAIGALVVFQGSASAAPGPVQNFTTTGAFNINAGTCWDDGTGTGKHPVTTAGQVGCGANTSEVNTAVGVGTTARRSFTYIQLPQGNRLTLPLTFTPNGAGQFGTDPSLSACGAPTSSAGCAAVFTPSFPAGSGGEPPDGIGNPGTGVWANNGSSDTGSVTAFTDLLCSGSPYDVLAKNKVGTPVGWPDDPSDGNGWNGFKFVRTADAGTGYPTTGPRAYVSTVSPFPSTWGFVSIDTAMLLKLFLGGGGAGFPIPDTPLQLLTTSTALAPTLHASVALLGGDPSTPPRNDYLCLDSPQNSETNTEYVVPPTSPTLMARWVMFTSAADFVNGAVGRIIDVQCLGTGAVTATAGAADGDGDDDCLTAAQGDTNDGNADQDNDGLPDSVEFYSGFNMNAADADVDGSTDIEEMFNFTDPNNADSDGDGSLDRRDYGEDETVASLVVEDTVADDNCPGDANADQLNTDSNTSYHGGNAFWNNKNAGTSAGPNPPPTLITSYGPIVSITTNLAGTTATVTTTSAHNLVANQQVEISGVTGMGGTAAQNNSFRNAINGNKAVLTPAGSTFTFAVPAIVPASPGSATATGTIIIRPATGDVTNPAQDALGDACDTDDDNDSIGDVAEPNTTYLAIWPGGNATSCLGDGSGSAGVVALSTTSGDSDQDMVLDGIECRQGSRPDIASGSGATCLPGSTGCAQPKAAATGEDGDADGLYVSGTAGGNALIENFYHTQQINQNTGPQQSDTDGDGAIGSADKDSDADWNTGNLIGTPPSCSPTCSATSGLQDGVEVRFYGTSPANGDTDTDSCDDGREAADYNGDRTVNPGDQATLANRLTTIAGLDNGKAGDPTAADGQVNPYGINFDLNKDKALNPGDQALTAFYVGKGGACQGNRQNHAALSSSAGNTYQIVNPFGVTVTKVIAW